MLTSHRTATFVWRLLAAFYCRLQQEGTPVDYFYDRRLEWSRIGIREHA
jgi:hypothetical protein